MKTRAGAFLLLLLAIVGSRPLMAHGGGVPQLVNEAAGPYWVSVWTSPDPLRVGQVHFTVSVAEPGEGQQAGPPILGATVRIRLSSAEFEEAITAVARNEDSANRLFYEADVAVPAEGRWRTTVFVTGSEGSGQADFDLQIQPSQGTNWFLLGGLALLAIGVLFLVRSVRRRS